MHIVHIAIWVGDLELMRTFYERYFNVVSGNIYYNPKNNFTSYFLTFEHGCRLELMSKPEIVQRAANEQLGLTHFAVSLGSENRVNKMTERFRMDGYKIVSEPRITGDGYYESVILDPEGNRIELTI